MFHEKFFSKHMIFVIWVIAMTTEMIKTWKYLKTYWTEAMLWLWIQIENIKTCIHCFNIFNINPGQKF